MTGVQTCALPILEELDAEGKSLRQIKVPGDVHEVVPLPDGHLLITCGDGHKVIELDASEKVVWELNENDLPGHTLRLMAGCQRLPNGNTVFCNYLGPTAISASSRTSSRSRATKRSCGSLPTISNSKS